jgi:hypothetical protein
MATYTITLTDAEDKALGAVAFSQDEWIQNVVHHRCAVSMEEIVNAEVQRMFAIGQPITGTKEEIVLAAKIKSAAERHAEALAQEQAQQQQV